MPADYHTHTPLCHHAEGNPQEYIEAALRTGLSEYGVSCHAPVEEEPFDNWRMLSSDLPEYFEWVEAARNYAHNRIPVRLGLECDWLPGCEQWITELTRKADWDYLIGSVHYLGGWNFDSPELLKSWEEVEVEEAWHPGGGASDEAGVVVRENALDCSSVVYCPAAHGDVETDGVREEMEALKARC